MDEIAERLFDLRRQILDPAAEGQRLPQLDDPLGDGGHGPRQIGAGIDFVLPADGDDRCLASLMHGDAQPVATQKLAAVVGGGGGDLRHILPALQLQDELLEVGQKRRRITGFGRFGLASLQKPRRVPGHLFDELQEPGASLARCVGSLEDLDGPDAILADLQGGHDDQKVDRHLARHRRIVGRKRGRLPGCDRVAQQPLVEPQGVRIVANPHVGEAQFVLERQAAGLGQPDGARPAAHRADEQPQKLGEESLRRGCRLREFLDLPGHLQDPVAGLLNAGDVGHADFALERGNGAKDCPQVSYVRAALPVQG